MSNTAHRLGFMLTSVAFMAAADGQTVISGDMGGSVDDYAARVAAETGYVQVRGQCLSACTMWLALGERVCTARGAKWGFHGATAADPMMASIVEPYANQRLAQSYPPAVRQRFEQSWSKLHGGSIRIVSGAEMIEIGVKECRK